MNRYQRLVIPGPNGTIHWAEAEQEIATVGEYSYVEGAAAEQPPEVTLEPVTLTPELAAEITAASHPLARPKELNDAFGPVWLESLPALPDAPVEANEHYRYGSGVWVVVQSHDRAVYGGDPAQYPALMRKARNPYIVEAWQQPLDQFDAYKLSHPVTGEPERCLHNGTEWVVTKADGSGNNVWEPGVFGWSAVRETVSEGYPEWVQPTGAHDAYNTGDRVSFQGSNYESLIDANVWSPAVYPAGWQQIP